jgi:hypothetical protein
MREFEGGASRDSDTDKIDPDACFSPLVIKAVSEYLLKHSYLPGGKRRSCENWQAGMPRNVWRKSLDRHVLDLKLHDRGYGDQAREGAIDALCAIIFNAQGRLLEELLGRDLPESLNVKEAKPPQNSPCLAPAQRVSYLPITYSGIETARKILGDNL